ncbi:MAG TPA: NUDIX domain-containing protein [Phycisphaerales bacterium]|nr:NUDIX domain-containing protein [Phycisphaerales bacterium]
MEPRWAVWAKELAAVAQNGLTYTESAYERERYEKVRRIAAEILAAGGGGSPETVAALWQRERNYATPKVDVRGVIFRDDKILLVREALDGGWTLPGGWADPCQSPREAVEREILEESGFEARAERLLAVYDRARQGHTPIMPFHIYKLFILCRITGGAPAISHETLAVDFFAEDAIPSLSLSRTLPRQIHRMFEFYRDPTLPPDFD